jgi:hypothetical protein
MTHAGGLFQKCSNTDKIVAVYGRYDERFPHKIQRTLAKNQISNIQAGTLQL